MENQKVDWVLSPVSTVPLWEQLLEEQDQPGCIIRWVKVPSHVTVEGINEADCLADEGRQLHPQFPNLHNQPHHTTHGAYPSRRRRLKDHGSTHCTLRQSKQNT